MKGHYITQNVAKYPLSIQVQSLMLLPLKQFRSRCIYKIKQYLTFDLGQGHTKCCLVPSTSCDLFRYNV